MSIFTSIDGKLNEFAKKYKAELHTKEVWFFGNSNKDIEFRRIFWVEGNLARGLVIAPEGMFGGNKDSILWQVENYVLLEDSKSYPDGVPYWSAYLLNDVPFQEIENKIDYLLAESEKNFSTVRAEDLRPNWT